MASACNETTSQHQNEQEIQGTAKSSKRLLSRVASVMLRCVRSSSKKSDRQISEDADSISEGEDVDNTVSASSECTLGSMHCLVQDQRGIMSLCYYWGNIGKDEADEILDNKPDGTFLLRDSSHEEFLFSVSYRNNGRTLHARIALWNHKFSFIPYYCDHYTSLYSCDTVSGLLGYYDRAPDSQVLQPILTKPLARTNTPTLQALARSVICTQTTYSGINSLDLPHSMKDYLHEYHYKHVLPTSDALTWD